MNDIKLLRGNTSPTPPWQEWKPKYTCEPRPCPIVMVQAYFPVMRNYSSDILPRVEMYIYREGESVNVAKNVELWVVEKMKRIK